MLEWLAAKAMFSNPNNDLSPDVVVAERHRIMIFSLLLYYNCTDAVHNTFTHCSNAIHVLLRIAANKICTKIFDSVNF